MKFLLGFIVGVAVGGLVIWFGFTKELVLLPSGTTLVEVDRFNRTARELPYSYEEANRHRLEQDERVNKFNEDWERQRQPSSGAPAGASNNSGSPNQDYPGATVELTAEELAQVKFAGEIPPNASFMNYRLYNGTKKVLVSATVRIEGVNKTVDMPVGRVLHLRFELDPASDLHRSQEVPNGALRSEDITDLKFTLVKVLAKAQP